MSHRVGSSCRPLRRKSHIVYLCRKPLSAAFTVELNAPTVTSKNRRSEDPKEERHAAGCRTARRAVERGNDPPTQAPDRFCGACVGGSLPRSHAGPPGRRPAAFLSRKALRWGYRTGARGIGDTLWRCRAGLSRHIANSTLFPSILRFFDSSTQPSARPVRQ